MIVYFQTKELQQPWLVSREPADPYWWDGPFEIPDNLVERFRLAQEEMQTVWDELRNLTESGGLDATLL